MSKCALNLDKDGRILSACVCLAGQTYNDTAETLPDGDITDYKYINNEYVYDPLPDPEPEEPTALVEYATYDELAAAIKEGVNNYGK